MTACTVCAQCVQCVHSVCTVCTVCALCDAESNMNDPSDSATSPFVPNCVFITTLLVLATLRSRIWCSYRLAMNISVTKCRIILLVSGFTGNAYLVLYHEDVSSRFFEMFVRVYITTYYVEHQGRQILLEFPDKLRHHSCKICR